MDIRIEYILQEIDQHLLVYIIYVTVGDSLSSFSCKPQYKSNRYILVLYKFVYLCCHWCWLLQQCVTVNTRRQCQFQLIFTDKSLSSTVILSFLTSNKSLSSIIVLIHNTFLVVVLYSVLISFLLSLLQYSFLI